MAFECEAEACETKEMPESGMPTEEHEEKENAQEIQPEKSLQVEAAENIVPDSLHNIDQEEVSSAICTVLAGSDSLKLLHTFCYVDALGAEGTLYFNMFDPLLEVVAFGYILLHLWLLLAYRNGLSPRCRRPPLLRGDRALLPISLV